MLAQVNVGPYTLAEYVGGSDRMQMLFNSRWRKSPSLEDRMERPPALLPVLAAVMLAVAAIDFFLLLPRGELGFVSGWMLGMFAILTVGLGLVLPILAFALALRDRGRRRTAERK